MATHDYIIDNSTGANVRADINNALAAIVSNNSNSSSPATTYAYQWWADTSNNVLKIRNSANNAWIELLQLDGTLTLEDGSAANPALANRGDLDTGVFFSADNTFDIATSGQARVQVDPSGRVGINETSPSSFNTIADNLVITEASTHAGMTIRSGTSHQGNIAFQDAANTSFRGGLRYDHNGDKMQLITDGDIRLTIDSSGLIGINTTAPTKQLEVNGAAKISGFLNVSTGIHIPDGGNNDNSITIGTGNDFRLYHDGSSSRIVAANHDLILQSNGYAIRSENGGSTYITIDSSGRLLIATTTAAGASTNADDLKIGNTDSSSQRGITIGSAVAGNLRFADTGSDSAGVIQYAHSSNTMFFSTDANSRLAIDGSGNIGAPTGTNIYNASDLRLKKNVVDLDKGLSAIKSLRPVSFNWIDGFCDEEKQTLYGFIAQEVETVDSNLIQEFGNGSVTVKGQTINDALRVNEKLIIPLLVKAVQELEAKVAALKAA